MNSEYKKEEAVTLILPSKNGEIECEVITVFELNSRNYMVLLPTVEDTDEIYIYNYEQVDEEEIELNDITDEEEWENAVDYFDSLMDSV
jgi:hypothetical protein